MAFLSDEYQYLLTAGLVGSRVNVYEFVSAEQGWLKEVASLNDTRFAMPSAFVFV